MICNLSDLSVFKYRKLSAHVGEVLARDRASAIAAGSRVIVRVLPFTT